ncbi:MULTISPECIES: hypothetical protein [unclassified Brevibacillus]|uniref:hypothetical protein n=1 Tax=unclassified Brevibacillus TaxID=2684853 RepID=UPI00156B5FF8|nr:MULTISPECIES: hypothetical protein [unclassified Brevibacillus]MDH6348698.1 hypothetical protein [Brevibacillus sp. 1238]UED70838.1 hypothetical protein HP435_09430 [Brevibacillus sp. HD3.3A]
MPSQDEQIILEELNQFPKQSLSRERSQAILEGVRKEGGKLQKVNKRKAYYGWMANGLITCGLLLGFFWLKPFAVPAETTSQAALTPEEQTYFAAAQKAVQAASGIQKTFPFDEIEKDAEYTIVRAKDYQAIVTFQPGTTEVRSVAAEFATNELILPYQKYVETAQNAFKEASQQVAFQKSWFFKGMGEHYFSFELAGNQHVQVDFATNKVAGFALNYNPKDVDQKAISIAQTALTRLSHEKQFAFTEAKKRKETGEATWQLDNKQANYAVTVGATTGQVYKVDYVTDMYKIKALDEVIPVTKPLIQDIFGMDISRYTAHGGKDWGGYVLRSPGKPSFSIHLYNLDVGNIYSIRMEK